MSNVSKHTELYEAALPISQNLVLRDVDKTRAPSNEIYLKEKEISPYNEGIGRLGWNRESHACFLAN